MSHAGRPLRLAVHGASGRMGQQLVALAAADARFDLVARLASDSDLARLPALDVVVDFSSPRGFTAVLAACRRGHIALVSGTTGLDDAAMAALTVAAEDTAVLHAANFSLGVAVLTQLLATAAKRLPDWQIEILEAHHAGKRDAPSGTALALGQAAAAARGQQLADVQRVARNGLGEVRAAGEIGFASLRAADIVGEHTALLATAGERLELTHRATGRAIFARGALTAAAWLAGQPAGHHTLAEMLAGEVPRA